MEPYSLSYYLLRWLTSGAALALTSYVVRGFEIKSFASALIATLVIGALNAFLWPLLIFLTLPINLLTLGLFTFVVNGAILKISAALLPGFEIRSWLAAIFGSIILSVFSTVLHYFVA